MSNSQRTHAALMTIIVASADDPHKAVEKERKETRERQQACRAKSRDVTGLSDAPKAPNVVSISRAKPPEGFVKLSEENRRKVEEFIAQLLREQAAPKLLTN